MVHRGHVNGVVVVAMMFIAQPLHARVGDSWGTNIHWTQETTPGEAAMLARAYKVARMDFSWGRIESKCGDYDFGSYDVLLSQMKAHGVRPYWILDYSNPCYPPMPEPKVDCSSESACKSTCQEYFATCADGVYYCCQKPGGNPSNCNGIHHCPTNPHLSACACNAPNSSISEQKAGAEEKPVVESGWMNSPCNTNDCIDAFGKFAAAAVEHFKGNGIIFECLNEPNGMGMDNGTDIAALCISAGKSILAANETFVGPATSGFAWNYLNESMTAGILDAFTAVSVHPYRTEAPETVLNDYKQLRSMIAMYGKTPTQKSMPILSGEWGYTSALPPCSYGNRQDEFGQAAYLARMWLTNTMEAIPVSINYDWRDDGSNATACESNFGSVHGQVTGPQSQPFKPKPAYQAALALQTSLGDFDKVGARISVSFVSPASIPVENVFILPFVNTSGTIGYAAWTNSSISTGPCGAPVPDRDDCGHFGIGKSDCLSPTNPKGPGCCWEPNNTVVGGPQCYKSSMVEVTTIHTKFLSSQSGKCWSVYDFLGQSTNTAVCADDKGNIDLTIPALANASQTTPVYLLPKE